MTARSILQGCAVAITGMSLLCGSASAKPPNIVLIMADDLGFSDLGCYGGEIETPNLDRMAEEGLRFTRFYNNAKCETTRTSLLNGVYAPEGPRGPGIAAAMKAAGYGTYMVGKWHQPGKPRERGFDRYFGFLSGMVNFWTGDNYKGQASEGNWLLDDDPVDLPGQGFYTTDAFTDQAIDWVDEANDDDKPFFLYLAHNAPQLTTLRITPSTPRRRSSKNTVAGICGAGTYRVRNDTSAR
jgi:arylsulfatase